MIIDNFECALTDIEKKSTGVNSMEYYHNGNFTWLKIKARGVEKEHAREVCSVCLYRLWLQAAGNENQSGSYAWSELNRRATSKKKTRTRFGIRLTRVSNFGEILRRIHEFR